MKLNFLKVTALVLMLVGTIFLSCDKDDSLIEPQKEVITQTNDNSSPVLMKLNYIYNNVTYNEADWDRKSKAENKQFYMAGLDENIFVFESEAESLSYEKLIEARLSTNRASGCEVWGTVNLVFKVNLFKDNSYNGKTFAWYKTQPVSKSVLGSLSGNSIDLNLPAIASYNTSSYKLEYITPAGFKGTVSAPCRDLTLSINFYTAKIEDLYGNNILDFNKGYTFYGTAGYNNQSKLSDDKLVPAFPLTQANSWDNKIKSLKVRIL